MKPEAEPVLLLPPLRTIATLVSTLTGVFLALVLAAHFAAGRPPAPAQPAGHMPAAHGHTAPDALYPYSDARNVGLY